MPLHENPMPTPVSPRAEGVTDPGGADKGM